MGRKPTIKLKVLEYIQSNSGVTVSDIMKEFDLKMNRVSNMITDLKKEDKVEKKKVPLKSTGKGGKTYDRLIFPIIKPVLDSDIKTPEDAEEKGNEFLSLYNKKDIPEPKPEPEEEPPLEESGLPFPDPTESNRRIGDLEKFTVDGVLNVMKEHNPNLHRLFSKAWITYTKQWVTLINTHYKLG